MTEEEIAKIWDAHVTILNTENVLAFTGAIEAKIREECAVICERVLYDVDESLAYKTGWNESSRTCAEAIRAGGKNKSDPNSVALQSRCRGDKG